jgi:protein-tyrosine phosphatase
MQIITPPILYKRGAAWLAFLGPFFFITYSAVNYFTSTRSDVGIVVATWERSIPFVPWLMLPYMSIDAFYAASLFLFRKRSALDRHAKRLLLATLISLIGFLLFPLQFSFEVPKAIGFNGELQAILLGFDKPFNQAPSMHISLLIVLWVAYGKQLNVFWRLVLHCWFLAIGASVLFVYQHHFIDVWTGALAGLVVLYLIPDVPHAWRWRAPTKRMQQLAIRYCLLAVVAGLTAFFASRFSDFLVAIFIWAAISFGLVAVAYFGFGTAVFQRDALNHKKGTMRWPAKLLLAPYLISSWISCRIYTRKNFMPNQILGNVWLGAFPRSALNQMGIQWAAVLDLTNEFPMASLNAPIQKYLPVMDLTPPSPKTLARAARWLERAQLQGDVLVHCALGFSRSASVIVCWLVWRGHAQNVEAAIAQVTEKRAGLVLSAEHIANIEAALLLLKKH